MAKAIKAPQNIDQLLTKITDKADAKKIQELLRKRKNFNEILQDIVKTSKSPTTIKALIEAGADIEKLDEFNLCTPLMSAVANNDNIEIISTLLKLGAKVNARNLIGDTAMIWAKKSDFVKLLVEYGAEINNTILAEALRRSARSGNSEKIKILVELGADVNARNDKWETPLMFAAQNKHQLESIKTLIELKAEVNAENKNGQTAIMYAAKNNNNPEVVKLLAKAGADLNVEDIECCTPLMLAIKYNQDPKIVKTLVEAGANVNYVNIYGITALIVAVEGNSSPEIIKTLLECGAEVNAVSLNRDDNDATVLQLAVEHADNYFEFDDEPPFDYDRLSENLEILLNAGACCTIYGPSDISDEELYELDLYERLWCIIGYVKNIKIVKDIMSKIKNINIQTNHDETLLQIAIKRNATSEIIKLLLEKGADLSARNNYGKTALDYAKETGNQELIDLLSEYSSK